MIRSLHPAFMTYLPAIIAVLVGVAVPLRASGVAPMQGALGLALIGALALLATNAAVRAQARTLIVSPVGKLVTSIFVVWAVISLFSPDQLNSLKIGGRTGLFILASVLVWAVLVNHHKRHVLLWKSMILAAVVFAGAGLLALNGWSEVASLLKGKGFVPTSPAGALKAFAASALCLVPVVIWAGRKLGDPWRWLGYAFAPMAVLIIIQTYNRAALAGFIIMAVCAAVLVMITKRKHVKTILALIAAGIIGVFARLYFHQSSRPFIEGTYMPEWLIDPHRQFIWKYAFEHFLQKPWFGQGIDQISKLAGASAPVPGLASTAAYIPSHPHNWMLELLAETGIVGFLPVLFVLGFIAWSLLKRYLRDDDEGDLALLALMVGFWSSALFNFSIWAVWWQLTFFILFAIVVSARPSPATES